MIVKILLNTKKIESHLERNEEKIKKKNNNGSQLLQVSFIET